MNERIKKLIEECTTDSKEMWSYKKIFDKEKFAEMIVRECCNILNDNRYSQFETVRNLTPALSKEIRREFGLSDE